jgi:flavin reductase (DIM6/NTAB) family NADH-FMN oxidoreductase RutF
MSMSEASVDAFVTDFKESMARVSSTVVVVTAMAPGGPHGTTVSAFMSLSVNPPMIVVSLDRASQLLARVRAASRFGVNVLSHDQADIARCFARKGGEKFAGVRWSSDRGLPRLDGAAGWLSCAAARLVDGGDHILVIGVVEAAEVADRLPLTYHARSFGTHLPLAAPSGNGGAR